jgi:hypothetical protein
MHNYFIIFIYNLISEIYEKIMISLSERFITGLLKMLNKVAMMTWYFCLK